MRAGAIDRLSSDKSALQTTLELRRRVHLYLHHGVDSERRTFAGIGKQDLSALGSSGEQGSGPAPLEEEESEAVALSVTLPNGALLFMPHMARAERRELKRILARMDDPDKAVALRRGRELGSVVLLDLQSEGQIEHHHGAAMRSAAEDAYNAFSPENSDPARGAILATIQGSQDNLYAFFQRVRDEQAVASWIRTDIAELKEMIAEWPEDGSVETFSYREVVFEEDGSLTLLEHRDVELSKAEAQGLLERLQGVEVSLGDFDNVLLTQLQFMVQRYQEGMNTVSNILQNVHETRKNMVQNLR
jgi:hypothetical protein